MASTTPVPARRLTRTDDGLTGVSGGIAEYVGIDPVWVRVGIIAGSLLTFPLLPLMYGAAWLIIPKKDATPPPPPPPPRAADARTASDAQDAMVAMAQARAEVEAIDRMPPGGPMPR
ncbi:MAG: PspC domain-containing protein [Actinomycetota bacterium]